MPPTLNNLLKGMVEQSGSDLHITTRQSDFIRTISTSSFDVVTGSFTKIVTTIERNGVPGDFGELFLSGSFEFSVNLGVGDYQGTLCE